MEFRIADTFTASLANLTGAEQKAVKTTAFDLQLNPANPGMQFHRIENVKDSHFWSVRVNRDIRLIVHKSDASLLLCYVDHHDDAYHWARRRKIERHPRTGAAQLVEIRERIKEIIVPKYIETAPQPEKRLLFAETPVDYLSRCGVPDEWIGDVRNATEDTLFDLTEHLPTEAAEALLELATGGVPTLAVEAAKDVDPFRHPDAQRRFRVMADAEDLRRALDYPWEKWTVFLHPAQRELVEKEFGGPVRVSGSAGTGKTIVALHRAVHLARNNPDARILLTTFSRTLANALDNQLRRLIEHEPRLAERLEVFAIGDLGRKLYKPNFGEPRLATEAQVRRLLKEAGDDTIGHRFSDRFIYSEWSDVVDPWQLNDWESYRDIRRLGQKKRLNEQQRELLWGIFRKVRANLAQDDLLTHAGMFDRITTRLSEYTHPPFDCAVVDEAQDIGVPELRFLATLGTNRPDSLFFTGDLGQRIFQHPFSWKALGINIRGRSRALKINYRTSHQIRRHADRLLPTVLSDIDGNTEDRSGAISIFDGTPPERKVFTDNESESAYVCQWIKDRVRSGYRPDEIGVIIRSSHQVSRAATALDATEIPWIELDRKLITRSGHLSLCTMHLAKGLEFRAVVVMACDDEVIPLQERLESAAEESELEEIYQTERHLLYVACTRARDRLLITATEPASEFLDDITET